MGPGSWTKLISSTPPLKGTVERLLYTSNSPNPSHDADSTYQCRLDARVTSRRMCVARNARISCGLKDKMTGNTGANCTQVNQRNWWSNTEEQKGGGGKWRKRWSISLKLSDKNDHCIGLFAHRLTDYFLQRTQIAVTSIDFACEHAHKMPSLFALPGPWTRLRSAEPKLTCRQFTPTINDFRYVRWYSAAEPRPSTKKIGF